MWDTRRRAQDAEGRGPGWLWLWVVLLPCAFWNPCAKAEPTPPADQIVMKTVTGTVVSATKRAISLEYQATPTESYELLLPYTEAVKLERIKSVQELTPGDTIQVTYRQVYQPREHGEPLLLRTTATAIALVKSAGGQAP